MEVLGVVGIRAGSKGVPDKNIRRVHGHPMVAWILTEALRATTVTRLVVSTESERYADIARHYGAEVPVLRPVELAADDVTDFPVLTHVLDHLADTEDYRPDVVLRLLATVPLQLADDIDRVVQVLLDDPTLTSAMVVARARQHPAKALRIVAGDRGPRVVSYLSGRPDDVEPRMRQSYEPAYFRANVVASRIATLRDTGTLTGDTIGVHEIPQDRGFDVDGEVDLRIVEHLLAVEGRTIDRPPHPDAA